MCDKTQSDYILEAPDDWDYEHKRIWAKNQLAQDIKREMRKENQQLKQRELELMARVEMLLKSLSAIKDSCNARYDNAISNLALLADIEKVCINQLRQQAGKG